MVESLVFNQDMGCSTPSLPTISASAGKSKEAGHFYVRSSMVERGISNSWVLGSSPSGRVPCG